MPGKHDPRRVRVDLLDPGEEGYAVHARHLQVGHDHGEPLAGVQRLDGFARVLGRGDGEFRMEAGFDGIEDGLVVVHEECSA